MFKVIEPDLKPIVISKEKNFKIIALSDFHVGGAYGYLPSGCIDRKGREHPQDIHQELKEQNLLKELINIGEVDVVLLLGDMIEGNMKKSGGLDVLDINMDVQVQWTSDLALKPIIDILKPKYVIGCTGSEYHVSAHADLMVTERLSNQFQNIKFYHGYPSAKFELGDKLWNLIHNGSIGSVSVVGALDRQWKKHYIEHYDMGTRCPEVWVYGHIHQAQVPVSITNGPNPVYGMVVPCQKRPDPFCNSRGNVYWDCGFLYIEQEEKDLWGRYINTYKSWETEQ